jgi:hypothetical protein
LATLLFAACCFVLHFIVIFADSTLFERWHLDFWHRE